MITKLLSAILLVSICFTPLSVAEPPDAHEPRHANYKIFQHLPGRKAVQNFNSIYDPEEVSNFMTLFIEMWVADGLPGDAETLQKAFDKIELSWQKYVFSCKLMKETPALLGLTMIRGDVITVHVYDYSNEDNVNLGNTSLGHELIHISLYATTGDIQESHHNHESGKFDEEYENLKEEVNEIFSNDVQDTSVREEYGEEQRGLLRQMLY